MNRHTASTTNAPEADLNTLDLDALLADLPPVAGDTIGTRLGISSADAGTHTRRSKHRTLQDFTGKSARAEEVVGRLPALEQSRHFILDGTFTLATVIPVIQQQTGPCSLTICTLGLNDDTTDLLAAMLKDGRLTDLRLAISSYFRASDRQTADRAIRILGKAGATIAVERVHAKLQVYAPTKSKARFVLETSSNLRSCNCIETATLTNSPALYQFHDAWLTKFFTRNKIT
jgi:hypothetical protein